MMKTNLELLVGSNGDATLESYALYGVPHADQPLWAEGRDRDKVFCLISQSAKIANHQGKLSINTGQPGGI